MIDSQGQNSDGVHTRRPKPAKSAGFTIIELMIVVTIAGIVASLAASNYAALNANMTFENSYRKVRSSFNRCRAESLRTSNPMTTPTSMVLFGNGYACIVWYDSDANNKLGNGTVTAGGDGLLAAGNASGEVQKVYFQQRFDNGLPIVSNAGTKTRIDLTVSTLQTTTDQSATSGYLIPIVSGGYFLSNRLESFTAKVVMKPAVGNATAFTLYTSGQIVGN